MERVPDGLLVYQVLKVMVRGTPPKLPPTPMGVGGSFGGALSCTVALSAWYTQQAAGDATCHDGEGSEVRAVADVRGRGERQVARRRTPGGPQA